MAKVVIELSGRRLSIATLVALVAVTFLSSGSQAAWAGDSATLFSEKCAGCHSIGGGNLVGPDLAPSSKWSVADLTKSIKDMEKNVGPLTNEEVDSLVEYLRKPQAAKVVSDSAVKPVETPLNGDLPKFDGPSVAVESGSIASGASLFIGDQSFKNGGLSCIACHRVDNAGGNMGPDLTAISEKMPLAALASACEHTPYKVMKEAYKNHAITHQEALDLASYLQSLKNPHNKLKDPPVSIFGALFAVFVFAVIAFGYRNRNTGVRAKLQRRN
ncbi:c-type cytochrome [bacterium]|nr:c-type cytochrome [bacterium]